MRSTAEILRGLAATALFAVFGAGALAVAPLMFLLRRPERAQPVVRTLWRLMARLFVATGLIRIARGNLTAVRGAVIVANHPTLIDVVLIVSLVPRTLYVAKHALRGNPFLTAIVRATALPDDARLPETAAPYLRAGWNVLVFPEGTRSPQGGGLHPLRRGAAQLAIRAGAPVVCIRETLTRRILAKGQRPWDMGSRRVVFSFRMSAPIPSPVAHGSPHAAAVRLTDAIRAQLASTLREPGKRRAGRSGVCSAAARIDWRCARFSYSP